MINQIAEGDHMITFVYYMIYIYYLCIIIRR